MNYQMQMNKKCFFFLPLFTILMAAFQVTCEYFGHQEKSTKCIIAQGLFMKELFFKGHNFSEIFQRIQEKDYY